MRYFIYKLFLGFLPSIYFRSFSKLRSSNCHESFFRENVTVILFCSNDEERIKRWCFQFNSSQNVVLVDNFSSDNSVNIFKSYFDNPIVVKHRNPGYVDAHTISVAIKSIETEWVFFSIVSEFVTAKSINYYSRCILKNPSVDGFAIPRISFTNNKVTHRSFSRFYVFFSIYFLRNNDIVCKLIKASKLNLSKCRIHHEFIPSDRASIKSILFNPILHDRGESLDDYKKNLRYAEIEARNKNKINDLFYIYYNLVALLWFFRSVFASFLCFEISKSMLISNYNHLKYRLRVNKIRLNK